MRSSCLEGGTNTTFRRGMGLFPYASSGLRGEALQQPLTVCRAEPDLQQPNLQ